MTQRDAFNGWWRYLLSCASVDERERALAVMQGIVDSAQNSVEHGGGSDGSFLPDEWVAARDLCAAIKSSIDWQKWAAILAEKVYRRPT